MSRSSWLLTAAVLACSILQIALFPAESKAFMRTIYVTLWKIAPKTDGVEVPDRFR